MECCTLVRPDIVVSARAMADTVVDFVLIGVSLSLINCCGIILVASSIQPIEIQTIMEGHNLTVSCNTSGTSPLMVSWIKVGSGERFDGKKLVFTHINRGQAGKYRCETSNECGSASETATIEVQCKL